MKDKMYKNSNNKNNKCYKININKKLLQIKYNIL